MQRCEYKSLRDCVFWRTDVERQAHAWEQNRCRSTAMRLKFHVECRRYLKSIFMLFEKIHMTSILLLLSVWSCINLLYNTFKSRIIFIMPSTNGSSSHAWGWHFNLSANVRDFPCHKLSQHAREQHSLASSSLTITYSRSKPFAGSMNSLRKQPINAHNHKRSKFL